MAEPHPLKKLLAALPQLRGYNTDDPGLRKIVHFAARVSLAGNGEFLSHIYDTSGLPPVAQTAAQSVETLHNMLSVAQSGTHSDTSDTSDTSASLIPSLRDLPIRNATSAHPGRVCGATFGPDARLYRCRDCQFDDTCVLCDSCFNPADHVGHAVSVYFSSGSGGCCDCGDNEAWKTELHCKAGIGNPGGAAGSTSDSNSILRHILPSVSATIAILLDYILDVTAHNEAVLLPRATSPFSANYAEETDLRELSDNSSLRSDIYGTTDSNSNYYKLVVWNDEAHSFDDAQACLIRAADVSNAEARELCCVIDQKGRAAVSGAEDPKELISRKKNAESSGIAITVMSTRDVCRLDIAEHAVSFLCSLLRPRGGVLAAAVAEALPAELLARRVIGTADPLPLYPRHIVNKATGAGTFRFGFLGPSQIVPPVVRPAPSVAPVVEQMGDWYSASGIIGFSNYPKPGVSENPADSEMTISVAELPDYAGTSSSRLQTLLYLEPRFSLRARVSLEKLIGAALVVNPRLKSALGSDILAIYPQLLHLLLNVDREPGVSSFDNVMAQLLTATSTTSVALTEGIVALMGKAAAAYYRRLPLWAEPPVGSVATVSKSREGPLLRSSSDIFAAIRPIKNLSDTIANGLVGLSESHGSGKIPFGVIQSVQTVLYSLQNAFALSRKADAHVLFDPESLFLPILSHLFRLSEILAGIPKFVRESSGANQWEVLQEIVANCGAATLKEHGTELTAPPGLPLGPPIVSFAVEKPGNYVTLCLPCHVHFADLLRTALTNMEIPSFNAPQSDNLCKFFTNCGPPELKSAFFDPPLRAIVLSTQAEHGLWVRNGESAVMQCTFFRKLQASDGLFHLGYAKYVYLLQVGFASCATPEEAEAFLWSVFDRFGFHSWLKQNVADAPYEENAIYMLEELAALLCVVVSDREDLGISRWPETGSWSGTGGHLRVETTNMISEQSSESSGPNLNSNPNSAFSNSEFLEELKLRHIRRSVEYTLLEQPQPYSALSEAVGLSSEEEPLLDAIIEEVAEYSRPTSHAASGTYALKPGRAEQLNPFALFAPPSGRGISGLRHICSDMNGNGKSVNVAVAAQEYIARFELPSLHGTPFAQLGEFTRSSAFIILVRRMLAVAIIERSEGLMYCVLWLIFCGLLDGITVSDFQLYKNCLPNGNDEMARKLGTTKSEQRNPETGLTNFVVDPEMCHNIPIAALLCHIVKGTPPIETRLVAQRCIQLLLNWDTEATTTAIGVPSVAEFCEFISKPIVDSVESKSAKRNYAKRRQQEILAEFAEAQEKFMRGSGAALAAETAENAENAENSEAECCIYCQTPLDTAQDVGMLAAVDSVPAVRVITTNEASSSDQTLEYFMAQSFAAPLNLEASGNDVFVPEIWTKYATSQHKSQPFGPGFPYWRRSSPETWLLHGCGHRLHKRCLEASLRARGGPRARGSLKCPLCRSAAGLFLPELPIVAQPSRADLLNVPMGFADIAEVFIADRFPDILFGRGCVKLLPKKDGERRENGSGNSLDLFRFGPNDVGDKYNAAFLWLVGTLAVLEVRFRGRKYPNMFNVGIVPDHIGPIDRRLLVAVRNLLFVKLSGVNCGAGESFSVQAAFASDDFTAKLVAASLLRPDKFAFYFRIFFVFSVISGALAAARLLQNFNAAPLELLDLAASDTESIPVAEEIATKFAETICGLLQLSPTNLGATNFTQLGLPLLAMTLRNVLPFVRRSALFFSVLADDDESEREEFTDFDAEIDKLTAYLSVPRFADIVASVASWEPNSEPETPELFALALFRSPNADIRVLNHKRVSNDPTSLRNPQNLTAKLGRRIELAQPFRLLRLPEKLDEFFRAELARGISARHTCLCLFCGTKLGSNGFVPRARHVQNCTGATGVFLEPFSGQILLMNHKDTEPFPSVYRDAHGEPYVARRGGVVAVHNVALDSRRYAHLAELCLKGEIAGLIQRQRDAAGRRLGWEQLQVLNELNRNVEVRFDGQNVVTIDLGADDAEEAEEMAEEAEEMAEEAEEMPGTGRTRTVGTGTGTEVIAAATEGSDGEEAELVDRRRHRVPLRRGVGRRGRRLRELQAQLDEMISSGLPNSQERLLAVMLGEQNGEFSVFRTPNEPEVSVDEELDYFSDCGAEIEKFITNLRKLYLAKEIKAGKMFEKVDEEGGEGKEWGRGVKGKDVCATDEWFVVLEDDESEVEAGAEAESESGSEVEEYTHSRGESGEIIHWSDEEEEDDDEVRMNIVGSDDSSDTDEMEMWHNSPDDEPLPIELDSDFDSQWGENEIYSESDPDQWLRDL